VICVVVIKLSGIKKYMPMKRADVSGAAN